MVSKKMLLAVAAIAIATGGIITSSFGTIQDNGDTPKEKNSIRPAFNTAYFEYQGTDELGSSLRNPANWQQINAPGDSECPTEGGIVCVTQIEDLPDYGGSYDTPEKNFAHYLDLQTDDGVTYISTPANRLKEKEE